jgi:hypothetical protein
MWHSCGEEECIGDAGVKARINYVTRRPRCRWEDNNLMDLIEKVWGGMDWYLWRALVNTVINLDVPKMVINN